MPIYSSTQNLFSAMSFFNQSFIASDLPGLQMWIDAADSFFSPTSGGLYTQVQSKGSVNLNFSTPLSGAGHTTPLATNINGIPAMGFNGSQSFFIGSNTILNEQTGYSAYIVMNMTQADTLRRAIHVNNSGGAGALRLMLGAANFVGVRSVNGGTLVGGELGGDFSNPRIFSSRGTASASDAVARIRHTSSEIALANRASFVTFESGNSTSIAIGSNVVSGSPQAFIGSIGEILIYSRRLTDSEDSLVRQYLSSKWKIV
jgi:hypothetical protein